MTATSSDALVFLGATGDLAHKKIFPALQAMVKSGHLNVPVIGVAKAGWDRTLRILAQARTYIAAEPVVKCSDRDRDRFVLSAWHGSALLYSLLLLGRGAYVLNPSGGPRRPRRG